MDETIARRKILIVDDVPQNIRILMETLKGDYALIAATNGEKALKLAQADIPPDLILLDITMPGMDGYEVCRRLKSDEKTRGIPVIFVTAKTEVEDEIKGFELGGVDYITKPISPPTVKARVKTHLSLKEAHERLEKQNAELREAARLREDVGNIMRHDLKGPLNSIIALPQIIMEEKNLDPEQVASLKIVQESGYRMLNMINLSLDLFKMERGIYAIEPVAVDILNVVRRIFDEVQGLVEAKNASLQVLVGGNPPNEGDRFFVLGEELLCYSMFSNLIKNAVEASPEGETISAILEDGEEPAVRIQNQGAVPINIRERFFEKYATSGKSGGTGLGTYSAKLIAETQGGSIELISSDAQGTTVTVRLPSVPADYRAGLAEHDAEDPHTREPREPSLVSLPPMRLLIVDDDEYNLKILEKYLSRPELKIDSAGDGKAALQKVAAKDFDMVLMDIEMPVMDGYETTHRIRRWELEQQGEEHSSDEPKRAEGRKVPIIALSSHDDPGFQERCREAGFTDCLRKPVDKTTLLETLLKNSPSELEAAGEQPSRRVEAEETHDLPGPLASGDVDYVVELDADMEELIPSFLENKKADLEAMRQAAYDNDFEEMRTLGHKLKGSFNMYGFKQVGNICHALEEAAKEQDAALIADNLKLLEDFLEKMVITYV